MALQSDRYMETLGWPSMGFDGDNSKNLTFSRRYLDLNRVSLTSSILAKRPTTSTCKQVSKPPSSLRILLAGSIFRYQYGVAPTTSLLLAQYNIGEPGVEHMDRAAPG